MQIPVSADAGVFVRQAASGFVFESEIIIEAGRMGHATFAVAIPAIYSGSPRKSHFRPVLDILRITRMVAGKLLQRSNSPSVTYHAQGFSQQHIPSANQNHLEVIQRSGSDI